jgi:hypothetical protein
MVKISSSIFFYSTKHFSIYLPIISIFSLASLISFFFRLAPLKFFDVTIAFCSPSSFGILFFISFLLSSNFVLSETIFAFLNYSSFIFYFVCLCFSSNFFNAFVQEINFKSFFLCSSSFYSKEFDYF